MRVAWQASISARRLLDTPFQFTGTIDKPTFKPEPFKAEQSAEAGGG